MVKLRCQDCGAVTNGKVSDVDEYNCGNCHGSLAVMNSEDDEWEPVVCSNCKKEIKEDEDTFTCNECDEENICEDCIIEFENSNTFYCKKCMDKVYPHTIETKIEYKERIVEKPVYIKEDGTPIDTSFNPNNKTRFD